MYSTSQNSVLNTGNNSVALGTEKWRHGKPVLSIFRGLTKSPAAYDAMGKYCCIKTTVLQIKITHCVALCPFTGCDLLSRLWASYRSPHMVSTRGSRIPEVSAQLLPFQAPQQGHDWLQTMISAEEQLKFKSEHRLNFQFALCTLVWGTGTFLESQDWNARLISCKEISSSFKHVEATRYIIIRANVGPNSTLLTIRGKVPIILMCWISYQIFLFCEVC